jgi:hypothetical protein
MEMSQRQEITRLEKIAAAYLKALVTAKDTLMKVGCENSVAKIDQVIKLNQL